MTEEEKTEAQIDEAKVDQNEINEANSVAVTPSAPAIEDDDQLQMDPPLQHLLYPNLQSIQAIGQAIGSTQQQIKEEIVLQPFTDEQLKELYNNPELVVAETFEADFINTELNSTHKDHPLYELIKKYSHSRYNLKVNMLDLHAYIKCFQENSQKVWIIENRITTYEGVCADGERIRKNELYE